MLKNYKLQLLLASLATLLPIPLGFALRGRLPEYMVSHLGFSGQPDAMMSTGTFLFLMPLTMLAALWLCVWGAMVLDKSNRHQNPKAMGLMLWIIPFLSNFCSAMMFALAMDAKLNAGGLMSFAMGLLFALIGNYLPKTRMNATMGIKIPWTYSSEENWNATHRFAGHLWVAGGLLLILAVFLPLKYTVAVLFAVIAVMVLLPMLYSLRFYRMQKARGEDVTPRITTSPKATKASMILLVAILLFCAVILFTGDLSYSFSDTGFTVEADWYSDLTVSYDSIDAVEYRQETVPGTRVGGFGSFRLLMGFFRNEEFGTYTRYTYYDPESCVVLTCGSRTYVLSCETEAATRELYEHLLKITG